MSYTGTAPVFGAPNTNDKPRPADPERDLPSLETVEIRHIARVLRATGGNQRRAARILGITRWSLARRMRKHGIGRSGEVAIETRSD